MVNEVLALTNHVETRATPFGPWKGNAASLSRCWQSVCQMGAPPLAGTHHAPAHTNGPSRVRIEARRSGQLANTAKTAGGQREDERTTRIDNAGLLIEGSKNLESCFSFNTS